MRNNIIAAMSTFFLISGCANYSKKECEQTNWEERGEELASIGMNKDEALSKIYNQCTKDHGISPHFDKFGKGFKEGNLKFCNPKAAFDFGKQGKIYKKNCPKELEVEFVTNYTAGLNIYLSKKVNNPSNENDELKEEIEKLKEENQKLKNK